MLKTKDVDPEQLKEGDQAILNGQPAIVDDVRCNSRGCWVYSNNCTSSVFFNYGEKVAKVLTDIT